MTTAETTPNGTTAMTPPPTDTAIEVFSYEGDAGGGFEQQSMADRKMPMIAVLQSNSPQVVRSRGKILPGQLINTVSEEVSDEIEFVPAITDHCFLLFRSRDDKGQNGGFRGRFPVDAKEVQAAIAKNSGRAFGKIPFAPDKDNWPQELIESFEIYGVTYKDKHVTGFVVISFTSTKIKAYKGWNTQLAMFAPKIGAKQFNPGEIPLFAHRVKMSTAMEEQGSLSWMVPVLKPAGGGDDLVSSLLSQKDPRYIAAKKLRDDVRRGLAKAAYETMEQDAAPDAESAAPF